MMFPYQSCELFSQNPNDVCVTTTNDNTHSYCHRKVEQHISASTTPHPHPRPPHSPCSQFVNITRKGRPRKSQISSTQVTNLRINEEDEICGNDTAKRRTIHRDIERHRRQEMSNLYSSLRSLLPMEYIKGKRSMCDHITEAAKYIKDLEKNVKELGDNRDKLKGSSSSSITSAPRSTCIDSNVSIHKLSTLIEIEINAELGDDQDDAFPLSRVVNVLIEEGLNIVSCVSSKVNQRWIYVIHCEVNDVTSIDSHHLQQKLMSEIGSCDS